MRITYIQQHFRFPEEPGGGRAWEFTRRLARAGHCVTVVCGGSKGERISREGVRVIRVRARYDNSMGWLRRIVSFCFFMVQASVLACRLKADVIFASSTPLTVAIPGILASAVTRRPFVFEVRDLWPKAPVDLGVLTNPFLIRVATLLERQAYSRACEVIALSPGMKTGVLSVSPRTPVTVIPNAADIDLFRDWRSNRASTRAALKWADRHVLLYAGGFGPIYGLDWLVDVAYELRSSPISVILCGSGAESDRLMRRAETLEMDPTQLFLGRLPKSEIARLLPAADIVVSSLADESILGDSSLNKVFDAMAAGRPMVFNHDGWLSSLMVTAGAGWRLPKDSATAAKVLLELYADPDQMKQAARESSRLGEQVFNRDELYREFESVLMRAANGSTQP